MTTLEQLLRLVLSEAFLFYVFAGLALASALGVVLQSNPIHSAFALIVTFCSLSAIYGLLGASFIAVLQIIVYAGAIMVLFLFVLMLLNVKREALRGGRSLAAAAAGLGLLFALQVGATLGEGAWSPAPDHDASTESFARLLFSVRFVYVFEATSILILAALVGAVVVAKKEL